MWPWVLIVVTVALWAIGDVVYAGYGSTPTVSFADVFYLGGYAALILGVLGLVRSGARQQSVDSVIDIAIVCVAAAFASWALVIEPIAEGVEHLAQQVALKELACGYIQGYLYAKPTSPAQTADTLRHLRAQAARPDQSLRSKPRFSTEKVAS